MNGGSDVDVVQHVLRHKTDYYRIFNLERSCTDAQIKSAYKKMALRCHPDKNKHSNAAEAFKIVAEAHSTLIDAGKRRVYDQVGPAGVQQHERSGGRRSYAAHPAGGVFMAGGGHAAARDIFEEFFGGGIFHSYPRNFYPPPPILGPRPAARPGRAAPPTPTRPRVFL
ncbi:unnamed protein product [Phytomonas sp. Hart1]|nr:unnamed protein product [Phytomonas sp. Hart1]|eukprot:CCW66955.1 unnamed protein product [Phytomonas sp. isolate Hart1]